MQVWVITNGVYDDATIVGVASSPDEADAMVMRMHISQSDFLTDFTVLGPFEIGESYSRSGDKV